MTLRFRDWLGDCATLACDSLQSGVQLQRIYRVDSNRDYGPLARRIGRADRSIDTELIAENVVAS